MELSDLKKENADLQKKLSIAVNWMEKEVYSQIKNIEKKKVSLNTLKDKDIFFNENIESIITKQITDFFGEILLLNTPSSVIENIISAEVSYYNLRENPNFDGLGVVTSYHKSLDYLIETYITKGFRKYAIKKKQTQLRQNDTIEKALNSVVNKGYILSVGRLYHLIQIIKNDDKLYDYGQCFKEYLEKYYYIKDIIFSELFISNFSNLMSSEILGKKRHVGKISFVETRKAREQLIGNFKNKNCMIYRLIELGKIE